MNRTFKKGMALLVAVVMCICLLPMAAFAIEVVDAPVAGTAYKFGMIQENVSSTTVYYLTGAMNSYYMDTTTDANAAIDVYLEQTTGVFALMGVSRKLPRHPVTEQLGRSTLLCFALHGKVMSILEWMLRRAVPGGYAQVLVNPWLSPLLAMMLTVLMALILLVPIGIINRWCPFLLGRKRRR